MDIFYLSESWPWFGAHQCYGALIPYVKRFQDNISIIETNYSFLNKLLGKVYSILKGWDDRKDSVFAAAEMKYSWLFKKLNNKNNIFHILFIDNHYHLLDKWEKAPKNIIGTIHHPIEREIPLVMKENLRRLSSAIVMCRAGVKLFEEYIGKGRVKFVPHGVDTDFFVPIKNKVKEKRVLFTGQNGRNFHMVSRIISRIVEKHHDVYFDIVIPEKFRRKEHMKSLEKFTSIKWHNNLTEDQMRKVYQNAYLLLMPLDESGVNNAIVESLACGLAIVTTDVGGIRDYGGGSIYEVVSNNDDDEMLRLIDEYISNPQKVNKIGEQERKFAEENLSWSIVARKHIQAYKDLTT